METDGFRNRQHRFSYLIAIEHAKRIRLDPSLLNAASRFMDRLQPDCKAGEDRWRRLLAAGVEPVVVALADRSEEGDLIRETAPAFGGIPAPTRRALLALSYGPLNATDAAK